MSDDSASLHAGDGSRPRIVLLIEDDSEIAQMMSLVLEDEGYRVIWRAEGWAGFSAAASFDPSAIVLDLKLPDVPGQEILRALKSDSKTSGIPVIIASATTFDLTPPERQLVSAVLGKPFEIEDLIAVIVNAHE